MKDRLQEIAEETERHLAVLRMRRERLKSDLRLVRRQV